MYQDDGFLPVVAINLYTALSLSHTLYLSAI